MDTATVVDLGREALMTALLLCGPIVVVGLIVGLAVGTLQAVTHIQDHTLVFVPKIVAMLVTAAICLPWLLERLIAYTQQLLSTPI